jgi:hypothetical protein
MPTAAAAVATTATSRPKGLIKHAVEATVSMAPLKLSSDPERISQTSQLITHQSVETGRKSARGDRQKSKFET